MPYQTHNPPPKTTLEHSHMYIHLGATIHQPTPGHLHLHLPRLTQHRMHVVQNGKVSAWPRRISPLPSPTLPNPRYLLCVLCSKCGCTRQRCTALPYPSTVKSTQLRGLGAVSGCFRWGESNPAELAYAGCCVYYCGW